MKKLLRILFFISLLWMWGHTAWSQCNIQATVDLQSATFPNRNDGRISITATGGKEPYRYAINQLPEQQSNVFSGLQEGNYIIKVMDAEGCETIIDTILSLECMTVTEENIIISGVDGVICLFSPQIYELTANIPDGQFTGPGVIDNFFNPQEVGVSGIVPITYRGNYMGCDFEKDIMVEITENCCPTPTNLKVDVLTPNQVNVTWEGLAGAINNYVIEYYPINEPTFVITEFAGNAQTTLTNFPTDKGNRWAVRVKAQCTDTEASEFTTDLAFRLQEVVCNLPQPLNVENITPTGAIAKWTAVPNVLSYTLEYRKKGNDGTKVVVNNISKDNTSLVIPSLTPDTEYEFRVIANCEDDKNSGFTAYKEFKTGKDLTVCETPKNVRFDEVRQTTAKILWTTVEGAFTYRICVRKRGDNGCGVYDNTFQVPPLAIGNLTADTEYEVIIRTDCGGIQSEPTEVKRFKTPPVVPPCDIPKNITITNITTNFARANWDHQPTIYRRYQVRFRRVGTNDWTAGLLTSRPPVNLNRLESDTEYEVQVKGYCIERDDSSLFSESVRFFTAPSPNCLPPRELVVKQTTTTTADLEWMRVGNADRYEVSYRVKGTQNRFTEALTEINAITLQNLAPNTLFEYCVKVYCKNGKESELKCGEFRTQLPSINCPSPNNIEFSNVTGSSFTVAWNPVANAISYLVFVKEVGGTSLDPISSNTNFATIEPLGSGKTYEVQVQSICEGNNTSPTTLSQFVTTLDPNGCRSWTKGFGDTNDDRGIAVATDANGNVYNTGAFEGTLRFGNTTLTSNGGLDVYVVKYDFAGNVIWAKNGGSTASDAGFAIDVNNAGEVFVTGFISGEAKFDNITVNSAGFTDIFVTKYSSNGTVQWVQRAGGNTRSLIDSNISDAGYGIVADNTGGCYVAGRFIGQATFGKSGGSGSPITLNSASATVEDAFVAQINTGGNFVWAKSYGGQSFDMATSIDRDADNNLWVSGIFAGRARFSTIDAQSAVDTTTDAFLAKLDGNGTALDVKTYGGRGHDGAIAVEVDDDKNAYLTGYFVSNMTVGTTELISRGDRDIFAIKVNNNMSTLWAVSGGSSLRDEVNALSVDEIGSVYITGTTPGQFPFGEFTGGRAGKTDMYILQLNANNGRTLNVKTINTDSDFESARGIATNQNGLIYLTGDFRNQAVISNDRVTSNGRLDAFVAKFCDLGNPKPTCPATKFVLSDSIRISSAKIAWDPVINTPIGGYVIYVRRKGDLNWQLQPAPNTPFVLTRLVGNTEYEVAVRTVCSVGDTSDFSQVIAFRTLPGNNCPIPGIITIDNVTENSVSIIWAQIAEAQSFDIEYRLVGVPNYTPWGNTANNFATITGLTKDQRYEVRVRTICSVNAVSDYSTASRFSTIIGTCAMPLNLRVTATTRNTISVSWSKNPEALNYTVQWRKKGNTNWTSYAVTDTFLRITNLLQETEYEIRVRARCLGTNNNSTATDPVIGKTEEQCFVPRGIQVTDLTGTIAEVTWAAAPAASSYQVEYRRAGETAFITLTVTTNSVTIPNLNPTTGYELRIRAYCTGGRITDYSTIFTFTTPILCATPITLTVDRVGLTEMRARWQRRSDVKGFILQYREEDSTRFTSIFVSDQVEETIKNLKPGTNYIVRLRAICDVGSGVPSNFLSTRVRTRICDQPTITTIRDVTTNGVTIEWSPIIGAVEYTIQIRRLGEDRWQNILSVDQTVYTIDGLQPNMEYQIQVFADCFVENSDPSRIRNFTTKPGCAPPPVVNSTPSSTSAVITWTAMPGATEYIVSYRRTFLDGNEQYKTLRVTGTSVSLPNLMQNTAYEVRVATVCGVNQSGPSNYHDFKTQMNTSCNRPRNYTVIGGNGVARISWDFMEGVRSYVVQYRRAGVQEAFINITLSSPLASSYTLGGLEPGVTYLVALRVNCLSGATEVAQREVTIPNGRIGNENPNSMTEFSVYPNPTRGELNVSFTNEEVGQATLQIVDVTGRIVFTQQISVQSGDNRYNFGLNGISAGIYQLRVQSGDQRRVTKLIVE